MRTGQQCQKAHTYPKGGVNITAGTAWGCLRPLNRKPEERAALLYPEQHPLLKGKRMLYNLANTNTRFECSKAPAQIQNPQSKQPYNWGYKNPKGLKRDTTKEQLRLFFSPSGRRRMPVQEHLIALVLISKTFGKAKASFVCCLRLFAFKLSFPTEKKINKKIKNLYTIPGPVLWPSVSHIILEIVV